MIVFVRIRLAFIKAELSSMENRWNKMYGRGPDVILKQFTKDKHTSFAFPVVSNDEKMF